MFPTHFFTGPLVRLLAILTLKTVVDYMHAYGRACTLKPFSFVAVT